MRYVLVQAFAMGVMFTYIAASPFIFQEHFNMSPLAYSLCFGANAIAIMLGSLMVSLFHDATGALRVGSIGFGKCICITWIFDVPVRWSAFSINRIGKYALYNRHYHRCLLYRYMVLQSYCNLAYHFKGNQTIKEIHK